MKCALISDTIFLRNNSDFFGMTITYEFLNKRYLNIFDEIIVCTRQKKIEDEKGNYAGYKIVNGHGVIVNPIDSYNNIPDAILRRNEIIEEITQIVTSVDKVIIRLPGVLGNFACKICKKLKIPYLIEMLACPWDGYRNHTNRIGKIIAPVMYFYTKINVKNAPNVLYVTNEFLQKRYPTDGRQIACSDVSLDEIKKSILLNRIEKINEMNINQVKLCTVANVEMRYKGHEYVIKAIAKLHKLGKDNFKYYLVGNGNQSRLRKIAQKLNVEDKIIFLGSLTHKEVFKQLDECDIYIQPSLQEGLPRAVLEAMSRACPCIVSNVGGNPELIEKKYIFKKKKIKQIVNILDNIDKNSLKESANENFNMIQNFENKILDDKRRKFYLNY